MPTAATPFARRFGDLPAPGRRKAEAGETYDSLDALIDAEDDVHRALLTYERRVDAGLDNSSGFGLLVDAAVRYDAIAREEHGSPAGGTPLDRATRRLHERIFYHGQRYTTADVVDAALSVAAAREAAEEGEE